MDELAASATQTEEQNGGGGGGWERGSLEVLFIEHVSIIITQGVYTSSIFGIWQQLIMLLGHKLNAKHV